MKNEKIPKLIAGKMNFPYNIVKAGYADGSNKPRKVIKLEAKPLITKLRKNERLVA